MVWSPRGLKHKKWQDQLSSDWFLPYCSQGASARRRKRKVGDTQHYKNGLLCKIKPSSLNDLRQILMGSSHIPSEMCVRLEEPQSVSVGTVEVCVHCPTENLHSISLLNYVFIERDMYR